MEVHNIFFKTRNQLELELAILKTMPKGSYFIGDDLVIMYSNKEEAYKEFNKIKTAYNELQRNS